MLKGLVNQIKSNQIKSNQIDNNQKSLFDLSHFFLKNIM